ncbi:MATE family efflux transporter [Clostridiales bacterium F-3ap]|uniref:Probable multidrug resistance protein NorM n=2 Tax=Anaerotalea alkaliphila TaxID=2662126 RepID=A0A7X5HX24_9FIRM|nr:MATE family efflux transporter [Anaerotalea alkaliphila]NDL68197.1 MATE family efflux transporter [Anaerotalea alkaliphila]
MPILLEQAFLMLMGVVNTVMAGRLGREAVSAIGMIDSLNNIAITFFSALAVGGTVVVAQSLGRQDPQQARRAGLNSVAAGVALSIGITLVLALFRRSLVLSAFGQAEPRVMAYAVEYFTITLFTYPLMALLSMAFGILRGSGNTKAPMKISLTMNVFNVVLGYLLIFGLHLSNPHFNLGIPGLGVRGAALAIGAARTLGALLVVLALGRDFFKGKRGTVRNFRFHSGTLVDVFRIGLPAGLESLLFNGGKLVTQVFVVGMGTAAIASNAIASSMFGLLNIPGTAISIAATTMVGREIGRKDPEKAKRILTYLVKTCMVVLLGICMLMFPFSRFLASIYTEDREVVELTGGLVRSAAVAMPLLWAMSFILPAGFKGSGDVRYTLLVSVVGMWMFRILVGYLLAIPLGIGVLGIWLGMYADWLVRAVLFALRLKNGKWNQSGG